MEQRALRLGTVVLIVAVLLRLGANRQDLKREAATTLLLLSSGRMVTQTEPADPTEQTQTGETEPVAAVPVFGQAETALVQVSSQWEVDTLALLQAPLHWELRGEAPTVLIVHTHTTESYENTQGYAQTTPYRTLEEDYNMLSIGDAVARRLEQAGIGVIHDRTLYDYPSYSDAYQNAREGIRAQLVQNPTICLVLDLHRDAAQDETGKQIARTATVEGEQTAQLMLVMGSDKGALTHEQWQKNLSLAMKLHAQLEKARPGLCRPIRLQASRYNQDLSPGALLVEVGSAGNTHEEALRGAEYLAEGIIALANGANT